MAANAVFGEEGANCLLELAVQGRGGGGRGSGMGSGDAGEQSKKGSQVH